MQLDVTVYSDLVNTLGSQTEYSNTVEHQTCHSTVLSLKRTGYTHSNHQLISLLITAVGNQCFSFSLQF